MEFNGLKLVYATPYELGAPPSSDEEYSDLASDDGPEFEIEDDEVTSPDIEPPKSVLEVPRPLQLNQDYDNWSAAIAPPVFSEEN